MPERGARSLAGLAGTAPHACSLGCAAAHAAALLLPARRCWAWKSTGLDKAARASALRLWPLTHTRPASAPSVAALLCSLVFDAGTPQQAEEGGCVYDVLDAGSGARLEDGGQPGGRRSAAGVVVPARSAVFWYYCMLLLTVD